MTEEYLSRIRDAIYHASGHYRPQQKNNRLEVQQDQLGAAVEIHFERFKDLVMRVVVPTFDSVKDEINQGDYWATVDHSFARTTAPNEINWVKLVYGLEEHEGLSHKSVQFSGVYDDGTIYMHIEEPSRELTLDRQKFALGDLTETQVLDVVTRAVADGLEEL